MEILIEDSDSSSDIRRELPLSSSSGNNGFNDSSNLNDQSKNPSAFIPAEILKENTYIDYISTHEEAKGSSEEQIKHRIKPKLLNNSLSLNDERNAKKKQDYESESESFSSSSDGFFIRKISKDQEKRIIDIYNKEELAQSRVTKSDSSSDESLDYLSDKNIDFPPAKSNNNLANNPVLKPAPSRNKGAQNETKSKAEMQGSVLLESSSPYSSDSDFSIGSYGSESDERTTRQKRTRRNIANKFQGQSGIHPKLTERFNVVKPIKQTNKGGKFCNETPAGFDLLETELDPALMEILSSHKKNTLGKKLPSFEYNMGGSIPEIIDLEEDLDTRVSVLFHLQFDPEFVTKEFSKYRQFIWGDINCKTESDLFRAKGTPISAQMNNDDAFILILEKLRTGNKICSDISDFVLVYDGVRVYSSVTPKAIGFSNTLSIGNYLLNNKGAFSSTSVFNTIIIIYLIDLYPRSVYSRYSVSKKEDFEKSLLDSSVNSSEHTNANSHSYNEPDTRSEIIGEIATEETIKIKIRNKTGLDKHIEVSKSVKISVIIELYKRMIQLSESAKVSLFFDDERINPDSVIGDTEIEDEDMITANY